MKIIKVIIVVLLLAILITGAYVAYNRLAPMMGGNQLTTQPVPTTPADQPASGGTQAQPTEPEKTPMPAFTVYDIDGNAHQLSDFQGKPVIMNFWATWCGYCQMEMPAFQEKFNKYGEQIHFLMIDMTDGVRETVEKASKFIEKEGYTFPVYYDVDYSVAQAYPVMGLPMTYFVDADGYFVASHNGALNADLLQVGIDLLLEEQ